MHRSRRHQTHRPARSDGGHAFLPEAAQHDPARRSTTRARAAFDREARFLGEAFVSGATAASREVTWLAHHYGESQYASVFDA
jgi:hypothetical protein